MMLGLAGAEIRRGIVRAFTAGPPPVATVELVGAVTAHLAGIPVALEIAGADMTAGALVLVVMFDEHNPLQAVVVAVYG
ncbi:MAG: hypothetical protein L6435_07815 [Anaerolineae bacterium]|nr:hypothetical protein [Anaerolineae bacterium]